MAENVESSLKIAKQMLQITYELKKQQLETLNILYSGYDCIAVLPTGYGKSVIFQLLPWFLKKNTSDAYGIVIVVSPLSSLMQDQVQSLCEKNIKACFLNSEGTTGKTYKMVQGHTHAENDGSEDDDEVVSGQSDVHAPTSVTMADLKKGHYNIIYAHPETLLNNASIAAMLRSKLYKERVCAIVVDEVHMISEWGDEFRKAFKKLAELVCIFPHPKTVHLALTATATPASIKSLITDLQLTGAQIVRVNPDRPNIFLEVRTRLSNIHKYEKFDRMLEPIVGQLKEELLQFPLTIVYINQLEGLGYCYQYTDSCMLELGYSPMHDKTPENRIYAQYHKDYTHSMKTHIVNELRKPSPKLRLVFATVALGMGLNAPSIERVIHFQPPTTVEKYFQEIGRAGRSGQNAEAILYYNKNDIAANRRGLSPDIPKYCQNKTSCLRKQLVQYFGFDCVVYSGPPHLCCSNCKSLCA